MDAKIKDQVDVWAVNALERDGNLLPSIPIMQSYIPQGGYIYAQLRAASPDGRVKKSEQIILYVESSVNTPFKISLLPSEFEQYEERIINARETAGSAADRAEQSAQTAVGAVNQCEKILEDVKANDTWREFGSTPCIFNMARVGEIKLKSSAESCSYHAFSDTIKDMDTQSHSYSGGLTEDYAKGYYEFILSKTATAWYDVYFSMVFTDLEIGKECKVYVDTTDLQPGSTTATMLFGQFLLAEWASGKKGQQILAPTRIASAGLHGFAFTPTASNVVMEYYPGNVLSELVEGYRFRFRDLYINRANKGTAHTPIYEKRGTFSGEIILTDVIVPVNFEATPNCSVWYSRPISNVFTVDGIQPNEDGDVPLPKVPVSRLEGKTLVCFGDNITGMFAPPTDYPSVIARLTGMTIYNLGMEGCRMSQHPDPYYDAFCMYRLADAVASSNYALQEAAVGHTSSYAAERVAALKSIDWNKIDYVTIMYGTNDIQGGVALYNAGNVKDTSIYLGAIRYALEKLWGVNPSLKILLITPIYRFWI